MVAKITIPVSVERTLRYNERKVESGKAVCLGAENCLGDSRLMTIQKKLQILQHRNALNDRAKTKTIHISLNFSTSEKLSETKLRSIASFYMDQIGFGEQPFFVYQHYDAGHPHIHIVSTTIRQDGSRINTHNIGRNQSEKARKETQDYFGLLAKEHKNKKGLNATTTNDGKKAAYGKEETAAAIASVLSSVLYQYNYTSLLELNAVLRQCNVVADRGTNNSRVYSKRGLYYRILNGNGNKIGVPIKASALPDKPTWAFLEQRFQYNETNRESLKAALENSLREVTHQNPTTGIECKRILNEKGIAIYSEKNRDEKTIRIVWIDTKRKSAFAERELGEQESVAAMLGQLKRNPNGVEPGMVEAGIDQLQNRVKERHAKLVRLKNKEASNAFIVQPTNQLHSSCEQNANPLRLKNKSRSNKQKNL